MLHALISIAIGWTLAADPASAAPAKGVATRPLVMVTNDDGVDSPGLQALAAAAARLGEVHVVAPATQQSGKGHALTFGTIRARRVHRDDRTPWHAVEATPATTVRLGIEVLAPRRPAIVLSGVNRGANLGIEAHSSGTVAAAREAAMLGVPSIAVSLAGDDAADYRAAAVEVVRIVETLRAAGVLEAGLLLSVNVPGGAAGGHAGVRVTRPGTRPRAERFERLGEAAGVTEYSLRYRPPTEDAADTDVGAFARGHVTVTPLSVDPADTERLTALRARLETPRAPAAAVAPAASGAER